MDTIKDILLEEGIMPGEDLFITPLTRLTPSPIYILNELIITQK
jgi:hypothetical protein